MENKVREFRPAAEAAADSHILRPRPAFAIVGPGKPLATARGADSGRWAPLGANWYDSLQVTLTKRYSRGLELTAAYTWQKELVLGSGGNPGLPGAGTNNVFNRDAQKSLASTSQPHIFVTGFTYLTPRRGPNKFVRNVLGDWTIGATLRYASGQLIGAPGSNNNLGSLIFQGLRTAKKIDDKCAYL